MPSRMSASDTRQLVEAERAHDRDEHAAAADDHVGPRLLEAGVVDAVGPALGGEGAEHVLGGRPRQRGSGGCGRGRTRPARCSTAATVVTVPARPTSVARLGRTPGRSRATSCEVGLARPTMARRRAPRAAGGSCCEELLGEAHAADVDREHASASVGAERRTRSSRRRCRRRGTGRRPGRGRPSRRGTRAGPPPRRSAARAATPSGFARPAEEVVAVGRVARRRRRRHARTRSTPRSSITLAVLAQHRDGPLDRVGCERAGVRVDALAEAGDVHAPVERSRTRRRPSGVGVGDEQAGRVRADVDATRDRGGSSMAPASRSGDPAADRVVAAGEIPGVVRVEALDPARVPPTPPCGRGRS